ncbi:MAG: flagellar basal-body rod protein FlgG [Lachnospiraceae bacterium]|nr:flagellar basal-body rod protein FlgG [Lachnospiraceae bacterium]
MMRSLWTAATGMKTQQTSLDNLSHNLANINTTGYKKERIEFESLLYQTIQQRTTDHEGKPKPITAQVGLGVRVAAISTEFTQGRFLDSTGAFDFAIEGEGFFMVQMPDGSTAYTRNGNFLVAVDSSGLTLTTANGYAVLDSNGQPITFPADTDTTRLTFDEWGNIFYRDNDGVVGPMGIRIGATQFNNPSGLRKIGDSYFAVTPASGEPRVEGQDASLKVSKIKNGYLEGSSVEAVDEMVDMIVTQRAYEMNSKAIQASGEMLQLANNLRS